MLWFALGVGLFVVMLAIGLWGAKKANDNIKEEAWKEMENKAKHNEVIEIKGVEMTVDGYGTDMADLPILKCSYVNKVGEYCRERFCMNDLDKIKNISRATNG